MLKSYGVGGGWVAWSNLVSAPVPFGFRSYWDLVGVGPRGFGTYGLGTGLDNIFKKYDILLTGPTDKMSKVFLRGF